MKEYDCEEYYEIGERLSLNGETLEVVGNEYGCTGCYFLNIQGAFCSDYCAPFDRIDDTSIYFKSVEQAKENTPEYPQYNPDKEYAVYERFQHNGVVAECTPCKSAVDCRACILNPCNGASVKTCKCMASAREDGVSVYYKRLDDVRP